MNDKKLNPDFKMPRGKSVRVFVESAVRVSGKKEIIVSAMKYAEDMAPSLVGFYATKKQATDAIKKLYGRKAELVDRS